MRDRFFILRLADGDVISMSVFEIDVIVIGHRIPELRFRLIAKVVLEASVDEGRP